MCINSWIWACDEPIYIYIVLLCMYNNIARLKCGVNLLLNTHYSTIKKEVLVDEVQQSFFSNSSNTFIT